MRVRFWGTRGSISTPGEKTVRYGGNTSCVEVACDDKLLIFDAGTGIRELGLAMARAKRGGRINILLSHTHWDHIQGFPFFVPAFIPGNEIFFYGPCNNITGESLKDIINGQMRYSYFPVKLGELRAQIEFNELEPNDTLDIDGVEIETHFLNHPVLDLGYRVTYQGKTVVYATDIEPRYNLFAEAAGSPDNEAINKTIAAMNERYKKFISGADILIHDAQYTAEEYESKRGWGHSNYDYVLKLAQEQGVKNLFFFHHDPLRDDDALQAIEEKYAGLAKAAGFHCGAAREGLELEV